MGALGWVVFWPLNSSCFEYPSSLTLSESPFHLLSKGTVLGSPPAALPSRFDYPSGFSTPHLVELGSSCLVVNIPDCRTLIPALAPFL